MQALIDYEGWRQWREIAVKNGLKTASDPKKESAAGGLRTISILRTADGTEVASTASDGGGGEGNKGH
jgi:hypothetical protein